MKARDFISEAPLRLKNGGRVNTGRRQQKSMRDWSLTPGGSGNAAIERTKARQQQSQGRSGGSNVRRGSSGSNVASLQTSLQNMGYNIGSTGADGKFGKNTRAAVMQFQRDNGLKADGIVGPNTRAAMQKASQASSTPTPTAKPAANASAASPSSGGLATDFNARAQGRGSAAPAAASSSGGLATDFNARAQGRGSAAPAAASSSGGLATDFNARAQGRGSAARTGAASSTGGANPNPLKLATSSGNTPPGLSLRSNTPKPTQTGSTGLSLRSQNVPGGDT